METLMVTNFKYGDNGRLVGERPGFSGYLVFLDSSNQVTPEPYLRYLVEVVYEPPGKRYCFVKVVALVGKVFNDLLPQLLKATWNQPRDMFSDPSVEIQHKDWALSRSDSTTVEDVWVNTCTPT